MDEDLYLSEIDNLDADTKVVSANKPKSRDREASGGLTSGFSTAKTTGELPTRDLFPHSPKKIGGSKLKSQVVVVNNNSSRLNRNTHRIDRKNQHLSAHRESKRKNLNRVIKKVQRQTESRAKPRRAAFIANPPQSAHEPAQSKRPALFKHINDAIVNPLKLYHIPKNPIQVKIANATATPTTTTASAPKSTVANVSGLSNSTQSLQKSFVSVGVQTEPCKCQVRGQQKNRNRRLAAKRAKDALQGFHNTQ